MAWRKLKEQAKTIIEDEAMRQRVGDAAARAGEASARGAKRLTALGDRLQSDAATPNGLAAEGDTQIATTVPINEKHGTHHDSRPPTAPPESHSRVAALDADVQSQAAAQDGTHRDSRPSPTPPRSQSRAAALDADMQSQAAALNIRMEGTKAAQDALDSEKLETTALFVRALEKSGRHPPEKFGPWRNKQMGWRVDFAHKASQVIVHGNSETKTTLYWLFVTCDGNYWIRVMADWRELGTTPAELSMDEMVRVLSDALQSRDLTWATDER